MVSLSGLNFLPTFRNHTESSRAHAEAKDTFAPPVVDFWEGLSEDRLRDGTGPFALIYSSHVGVWASNIARDLLILYTHHVQTPIVG